MKSQREMVLAALRKQFRQMQKDLRAREKDAGAADFIPDVDGYGYLVALATVIDEAQTDLDEEWE